MVTSLSHFFPQQVQESELEEKVGEVKAVHEEYVKEEKEIRASKIDIDQQLEKYDGIIKENKSKISHWKKQVSVCHYNVLSLEENMLAEPCVVNR